jgi:hypothetical protein
MYNNTTGTANTAIGADYVGTALAALENNTTGNFNVGVGTGALGSNTTASNNTAVGYQAGYSNTTGNSNTYIGRYAGYTNSTSGNNLCVGDYAGYFSTGADNTFVGARGGSAAGDGAGYSMTTGSKNTIIGKFGGNQGGLDIRTASNYIVLSDGDGNPRIINNSGQTLLNATTDAAGSGARLHITGADSQSACSLKIGTNGYPGWYFANASGTKVGDIVINSGGTAYNTTSDYRLKNTIAPMTGALAKVALLKPCTYKWNADGSSGQGFIAHELAEIVPGCVTGEKDAVEIYTDENGNEATRPAYQGIDTSFLVATLTAAIQEQQALIQDLTTRLAALEAK